jgi:hypothetical protein
MTPLFSRHRELLNTGASTASRIWFAIRAGTVQAGAESAALSLEAMGSTLFGVNSAKGEQAWAFLERATQSRAGRVWADNPSEVGR